MPAPQELVALPLTERMLNHRPRIVLNSPLSGPSAPRCDQHVEELVGVRGAAEGHALPETSELRDLVDERLPEPDLVRVINGVLGPNRCCSNVLHGLLSFSAEVGAC